MEVYSWEHHLWLGYFAMFDDTGGYIYSHPRVDRRNIFQEMLTKTFWTISDWIYFTMMKDEIGGLPLGNGGVIRPNRVLMSNGFNRYKSQDRYFTRNGYCHFIFILHVAVGRKWVPNKRGWWFLDEQFCDVFEFVSATDTHWSTYIHMHAITMNMINTIYNMYVNI